MRHIEWYGKFRGLVLNGVANCEQFHGKGGADARVDQGVVFVGFNDLCVMADQGGVYAVGQGHFREEVGEQCSDEFFNFEVRGEGDTQGGGAHNEGGDFFLVVVFYGKAGHNQAAERMSEQNRL